MRNLNGAAAQYRQLARKRKHRLWAEMMAEIEQREADRLKALRRKACDC